MTSFETSLVVDWGFLFFLRLLRHDWSQVAIGFRSGLAAAVTSHHLHCCIGKSRTNEIRLKPRYFDSPVQSELRQQSQYRLRRLLTRRLSITYNMVPGRTSAYLLRLKRYLCASHQYVDFNQIAMSFHRALPSAPRTRRISYYFEHDSFSFCVCNSENDGDRTDNLNDVMVSRGNSSRLR